MRVRDNVDDAQAVKTLAHALANVLLLCSDAVAYRSYRDTAEIDAESIAYPINRGARRGQRPHTAPYVAVWPPGTSPPGSSAPAHRILVRR